VDVARRWCNVLFHLFGHTINFPSFISQDQNYLWKLTYIYINPKSLYNLQYIYVGPKSFYKFPYIYESVSNLAFATKPSVFVSLCISCVSNTVILFNTFSKINDPRKNK
jgi:hypothetical protein